MSKSTFIKPRVLGIMILGLALIAGNYSFLWLTDRQQALLWASRCLLQSFDTTSDPKLKKWDLTLTPDAFIRFKKTYQNGRQEYYSFNLQRFKEMDYLGTTTRGTLRIKTLADDVIVQTYHDPKGDVDSMSTTMKIPLRAIEAEQLDSLLTALSSLKVK